MSGNGDSLPLPTITANGRNAPLKRTPLPPLGGSTTGTSAALFRGLTSTVSFAVILDLLGQRSPLICDALVAALKFGVCPVRELLSFGQPKDGNGVRALLVSE